MMRTSLIGLSKSIVITMFLVFFSIPESISQLSPGDLAQVHAHLEGLSNCTKCHTLGDKVSNEKCLDCHTEIRTRITAGKGYHASTDVDGKECAACHSDHHGRTFRIVNFETAGFNHAITGYRLTGAHSREQCTGCHQVSFIRDEEIRKKSFTYLGLDRECLSCHEDYHRKTLSSDCAGCHGDESFKPAVKFDHQSTKFPLAGKHLQVACASCHSIEMTDGKKFQRFSGIAFSNCTSCHEDVHKGKFGQNCRDCHNEETFHQVAAMESFDHNRTDFPLLDKHVAVSCKSCHKGSFTDPLPHDRCVRCHQDYHRSQFSSGGLSPDCAECHTTRGFSLSSYSIERHNQSRFALAGAHLATPCFDCHKKTDRWEFREIGIRCADCHSDIHQQYIDPKYYPEKDCRRCHSESRWSEVAFDHSTTVFSLTGAHGRQSCRKCHFREGADGQPRQQFRGLPSACNECHTDSHYSQFESDGATLCERCHVTESWKIPLFDHSKTRFPLDGQHINVACNQCHKAVTKDTVSYIQYKFGEFKCETCHR